MSSLRLALGLVSRPRLLRVPALTFVLALACAGALPSAEADDPPPREQTSVVVLSDGQTVEGIVRIEGPTVRIIVGSGVERAEIVLAAESVKSIDARDRPEQVVDKAAVRLKDGRVLRGRAIRYKGLVRVVGAHGELEVPISQVARIEEAEEERARLLVDGDLGVALPLGKGWLEDDPSALGERLRLVDEEGEAFISVLARTLGQGDSTLTQVRDALVGDLSPRAQVSPRDDRFWIEDEVAAPGSPRVRLRHAGWVYVRGEYLVWVRAATQITATREAREAAEALAGRVIWLEAGIHERAALLYAPDQRLLLNAPDEATLDKGKDPGSNQPAFRLSERREGSLEVFFLGDDDDPESALRDRFEGSAPVRVEVGATATYMHEGEGLRALGYAVGRGSVLLVARAANPDVLVRLMRSARLLDSAELSQEIAQETRVARQKAEVRLHLHEQRRAQAERIVRELLVDHDEDPELLGLAVECRRESGAATSEDLDDLWSALGAAWTARELSEALLEEGRARKEEDYPAAADALERAAMVWPTPEIASEVQGFFLQGAREAFKAGDAGVAWARLARARGVSEDSGPADALEQELRLTAAETYLEEKSPSLARAEARRAYDLGADAARVEALYDRAERIQLQLEQAAQRRNRGGGFRFGIPPTRSGGTRQGRIRTSAFTDPQRRSRRIQPRFRQRSNRFSRRQNSSGPRRVRPLYSNQSGSRSRVRSRARVLFQSRS